MMNMRNSIDKQYEFIKGYNLFYEDKGNSINIFGSKNNIVFYLSTASDHISRVDEKVIDAIKNDCTDDKWYILRCPKKSKNHSGHVICIKDCYIAGEVSKNITVRMKEYLRQKEIYA